VVVSVTVNHSQGIDIQCASKLILRFPEGRYGKACNITLSLSGHIGSGGHPSAKKRYRSGNAIKMRA